MRPPILFPLFADLTTLSGVGPKIAAGLSRLAGAQIVDLLFHLPQGVVDRRHTCPIAEAPEGKIVTLEVRVDTHRPARTRRLPHKVTVSDTSGFLTLVFFHAEAAYLERQLPPGETRIVSGTVEGYGEERQMIHPDYIVPPNEADQIPPLEPQYPLTHGITQRTLGKIVRRALDAVPDLPEWLDTAWAKAEGVPPWATAIRMLHTPKEPEELASGSPARRRLAFDELLANQLAIALVRDHQKKARGHPIAGDGAIQTKARAALPFALTGSQETALHEITADMASPHRMVRLLQGDVGSGKTVVAFLAMANAVEAGFQAALMAPTEILARQHYATMAPLAEASGVRLEILTGREKGPERKAVLERLAQGQLNMLVGTHALFQEEVQFRNLGFAVVDEQHRFGVHERMKLTEKGRAADLLVMTATPIPRTLTLTAYGDMSVSKLTEKPAGRKPVTTRAVPLGRMDEVVGAVRRAIEEGSRVYWVCPLVEESEVVDAAAAEERHAHLSDALGRDKVGLVHGRMKASDKDAAMSDFAAGRTQVLVATTVIEVGVDVPEATVIVIEHAERFGLAQLHQLRGRVGRGTKPSSCVLLYQAPLGETARARLDVLRRTNDGFLIAEEDLRLRGAGELLGTKQAGFERFRMADAMLHSDLLVTAHKDAARIIATDPHLETERGQALRVLLYLFSRDEAVRLLRSG